MLALFLLLQVCGVLSIENPVKDDPLYQAVGALPSQKCDADTIGVGNMADLLNTEAKLDAFRDALPQEQRAFFDQIRASPKHSLAGFTKDEFWVTFANLYAYLDESGKAIYISLILAGVSEDQLKDVLRTWAPIDHLVIRKEVMCGIVGDFNDELLSIYCRRLTEPQVSVMTALASTERCSFCILQGIKSRTDETLFGKMSPEKCEGYMNKVRQYKADDWDVYYTMWCPTAITPGDIDRIQSTHFCNTTQQASLMKTNFTSKLRREVLRTIGIKLVSCFGSLDSWTSQQVMNFAPYIAFMPRANVAALSLQKVIANYDAFAKIPGILDSSFLRVIGFKVAAWWGANEGSLSADVKSKIICLVAKFSPDRDLISQISTADLLAAFVSGCPDLDLTAKEAGAIVQEVVTGITWDASKLAAVAPYIGSLTVAQLKLIPDNVLCTNWASANSAKIAENKLAYIWSKCSSSFPAPGALDCDKLKEIGSLLAAMPLDNIKLIDQAVIETCIGDLAGVLEHMCRKRPGVCKEVMKKVAAVATGNSESVGKYLQYIGPAMAGSIADFSSVTIANLGGYNILSTIDFTLNKKMAGVIWAKVKEEKNAVTRDNLNYCTQDFLKFTNLFWVAAKVSEIRDLCEGDHILEAIGRAAEMLDKLDGTVIRAIIDKVLKLFGANDDNVKAICIDGPMIKQAAAFLPYANGKDLAKFNKKSLREMFAEVGQQYEQLKKVPRAQMRFITSLAKKAMNLGASVSDADIKKTGPYIWCGMVKEDLDTLSDGVIETFGKDLMQCTQLDLETMKLLVRRFKGLSSSAGASAIKDYGPMIIFALAEYTDAELTASAGVRKILADIVPRLMEVVNGFLHFLETKDDREVPAAEMSEIRTIINTQLGRIYGILQELQTPATRKKRSTASGGCSVLSSFDGNVAFLTAQQITALDTADLMGCLPDLADTVWSSEQCTELRAHLIHADGLGATTSSWQKEDVQALGTLVDCLQTGEVQNLQVDDLVLNALGGVVLAKAADVLTAYFTHTTITTASAVTSEKLSDFGNMACGLSASEIGTMASSVVHESAGALGGVGCMDQSQLEAVGTHIVAEEGADWSAKDPAVVDELRIFVAGLSEAVLTTFGEEQVQAIRKEAIAAIPPATMEGAFTAAEFAAMSTEQSNAVTEAQLAQLSEDKKAKVTENTNYVVDVDISDLDGSGGSGGSGSVDINALTLLVTLTATFLSQFYKCPFKS